MNMSLDIPCPISTQRQEHMVARSKTCLLLCFFDEATFWVSLHWQDLRVVCDGSKKETHGTSPFTVAHTGFRPFLAQGMVVVIGSPEMMTLYCAELFGILSTMAWFEDQITSLGLSKSTVYCSCNNQTCVDHLLDSCPMSPQIRMNNSISTATCWQKDFGKKRPYNRPRHMIVNWLQKHWVFIWVVKSSHLSILNWYTNMWSWKMSTHIGRIVILYRRTSGITFISKV